MEALYAALEGEIDTFVGHVQQCRQDFDLRTLYDVLLLVLPRSPSGQVESWEHLERLAERQPGSPSPDVAGYVGWLASYLQHLRALKERFDARVVFPLCENLYVHEDSCPSASIPRLATHLFARRRSWALLLRGGPVHEQTFSPRSLHDLHGFTNTGPVVQVLRLVPDIFHQSLATAELARRWVRVHQSRYSLSPPLAPGSVQPPPCSRTPQPPSPAGLTQFWGAGSSAGVLRAQLQESQEELLALLPRAQRAAALRAQIRGVTRRIRALRLQQQCEGMGMAMEPQDVGPGGCPRHAALLEELQKRLELEEYHRSILEADWLLELEVRPILVRRIDAVQQRCWDLERVLRGQALAVPLRGPPRSRTATTPAPGQAQPSAMSPTPAAKPSPSKNQRP
ncbi:uncharacterized protein LOC121072240 [Cygnus olor]|uniref:uncharacterized protein LOC121072240 n=1 Tax=Cygnus olor TaxID=8869 RepID=UPI001ADEB6BF|nr:uncharacterized protein LOC121072240 [Cygnus olor]